MIGKKTTSWAQLKTIKTICVLILVILSIYNPLCLALTITHQTRPNSSFDQTALNSSCSTFETMKGSYKCNSAIFPYDDRQGVALSINGKADGDAIDNGRDLIFDPITEDLIRRLFRESNYNSFTLNTELSFKTSLFEISYMPYYLLGDLFLFNPSFPEISMNLINHSSLKITSGTKVIKDSDYNLSIGGSFFYYEHSYENTSFSLFDLTTKRPNELVSFKTLYGVSGDVGTYFNNTSTYFPNLSAQIKNIGSEIKTRPELATSYYRMTNLFLFETYSTLGAGKSFKSTWGGFDVNLEFPFGGYYEAFYSNHITLGFKYSLSLFSILLGLSQEYFNIGTKFDSKYFSIGISYSRENDMGEENGTAQNSVYTGIDIYL